MSEPKIERQKLTWRHVAVVVTMCLTIGTAVGIVFLAAGLCYRPVAEHFGVQVSDVSLYVTCVYLGGAVGPVPAGWLFDRFNPKIVFGTAALLVIVPYLGFAFYPAIWCFWVAGFIIGLGLCALQYTMTAGILSRWFHTNYGTVIGITFAMTGLGGICWNLIGQHVLGPDLSGWPQLYLILGCFIAVGTLPGILLFVRRTPEEVGLLPYGMPLNAEEAHIEQGNNKVEEPGYTFRETIRMPLFYIMLLGCGLMNIVTIICQLFATYIQFLGHDGWYGVPLLALLLLSGTLEAFTSGGQMIGKVIVGWVESRHLLGAQIMGVCGGVVGVLLMWQSPKLLGEAGIMPMFMGGAFYGLMYACSTAMIPFLIREVFGGRDYNRIYSVQVMVYNAVGAFGATAWAVIAQTWGWDAFFIASLAVIVVTFLLFAYTGQAGYRKRAKTWYKSDEQLAAEGGK